MVVQALIALLLSLSAQAVTFSAHTCTDSKKIVSELIEFELSGGRWQGRTSSCLKQARFQTLIAKRQESGDAYLLQPEYLLSKGQDVKIVAEKKVPDLDAVEVEIGYLAKKYDSQKDQKEVFVKDRFVYRTNYGKNREKMGCVSLLEEPEHFVMKEECLKK